MRTPDSCANDQDDVLYRLSVRLPYLPDNFFDRPVAPGYDPKDLFQRSETIGPQGQPRPAKRRRP